MNERFFCFKYDDKVEYLTIAQARALKRFDINTRIEEILYNSRNKRMKKDGFEPGWQENIQEYVGGRIEYDKRLKELGLVELGYDEKPHDTSYVSNPTANLEFALYAKEIGAVESDREVEALASGELLKDVELDKDTVREIAEANKRIDAL